MSDILTVLQKRAREEDVEIIIRMPISRRARCALHRRRCGGDQPDQKELQDALDRARKDLDVVYDRLHEMTAQSMDNEAKFKRERLIKDLAVAFIPKDKLYDFKMSCPLMQPQWTGSSSPLVESAESADLL